MNSQYAQAAPAKLLWEPCSQVPSVPNFRNPSVRQARHNGP